MMRIISNFPAEKYPHIGSVGESKHVLLKPWKMRIGLNGFEYNIIIPAKEHEYDGFTGIMYAGAIKFDNIRTIPAWLVHDHLYITEGKLDGLELTREEVDYLFYLTLLKLGYGPRRSWLTWKMTRIAGRFFWNDK